MRIDKATLPLTISPVDKGSLYSKFSISPSQILTVVNAGISSYPVISIYDVSYGLLPMLIVQVSLPLIKTVNPCIGMHPITSPDFKPVPKSFLKRF